MSLDNLLNGLKFYDHFLFDDDIRTKTYSKLDTSVMDWNRYLAIDLQTTLVQLMC